MYVMFKHKLPVLAALLLGAAAPALAANESAGDCSFNATSSARNLCHDLAVMRDYALGLTSDTFVDTPPVSLNPIPRAEKETTAQRPLSLLPGGLAQSQESRAPQAAQDPVANSTDTRTARLPKITATRAITARAPQGPKDYKSIDVQGSSASLATTGLSADPIQPKAQAGAASQRRYVALGDFTTPGEAIAVAQKFNLWTPRIQHVYVNGRHYSRVLVGPFADRSIKSVQAHLDQHGFSTAWPLRATADATPDTLIARYPGDG